MTQSINFGDAFEALTRHRPFPWQRRLFEKYFLGGALPSAVDVPTGLGKTAVMAVWLLARAAGAALPRRLVYVVDRRAVVDQATEFAMQLRDALEGETLGALRCALDLQNRRLPISTLRGRHVDNRAWMADPSAPAIVVGTVDMVGSRLLFEGYGLSRHMRPYAAGLLGCDTLAVLDEAHLARPFERLLRAIAEGQCASRGDATVAGAGMFAGAAANSAFPPPFRVLPLSATLKREPDSEPFGLECDDWADETVRARLGARKSLTVEDLVSGSNLHEALAERAWQMMQAETLTAEKPPRVAIYCDRRTDAEKAAKILGKRAEKEAVELTVILFAGGRRIYERQEAAERLKHHGLIGDGEAARRVPVFLVATSAGEVGVDLDTDHMVCDLVPWERMIQRLGRVNRRGTGAARVAVIDQGPPGGRKADDDAGARRQAVRGLLDALPLDDAGGLKAGPAALGSLAADPARRAQVDAATTRTPLYPALTRPLVDAWAMTSLEEHAGRPEVAPWLRGWVEDEAPQTAVVWRQYLPLRLRVPGGAAQAQTEREVRAFFAAAPPQTVELLETETGRAVQWLKKRARKHLAALRKAVALPTEPSTIPVDDGADHGEETVERMHLLAPLTWDGPVAFLLDGANRPDRHKDTLSLTDIDRHATRELHASLAGKRLVVDARLGGIEEGLLDDDAASGKRAATIEDNWGKRDDDPEEHPWTFKVEALPEGEGDRRPGEREDSEGRSVDASDGWRDVLRAPLGVSPEGEPVSCLIVSKRRGEGESEDARAVARKAQRLDEHQRWAEEEAERIADKLGLGQADKAMLAAAARHHDDGKGDPRWQRAFNAPSDWRKFGPYAKTVSSPNQLLLNGFRHEFKSALDAERNGLDGIDRADARFELALHLIAAHHGRARPAIGVGGYDDMPPSQAEAGASAVAGRFARLQKRWGPWGLAWWEALLRAADQAASKRLDREAD